MGSIAAWPEVARRICGLETPSLCYDSYIYAMPLGVPYVFQAALFSDSNSDKMYIRKTV